MNFHPSDKDTDDDDDVIIISASLGKKKNAHTKAKKNRCEILMKSFLLPLGKRIIQTHFSSYHHQRDQGQASGGGRISWTLLLMMDDLNRHSKMKRIRVHTHTREISVRNLTDFFSSNFFSLAISPLYAWVDDFRLCLWERTVAPSIVILIHIMCIHWTVFGTCQSFLCPFSLPSISCHANIN